MRSSVSEVTRRFADEPIFVVNLALCSRVVDHSLKMSGKNWGKSSVFLLFLVLISRRRKLSRPITTATLAYVIHYISVTGQFADKSTCGQSSHRLVNLQATQVAEMFDLKFGVYNRFSVNLGSLHY